MYTILANRIMRFWILMRAQLLPTVQRAIIYLYYALTNMFYIFRKYHLFLIFRAVLIVTRNNNLVSHTDSESHHWFWFRILNIAKWTLIFSLTFLFPLLVTVLASYCNLTFQTYYWLISKHCAYTAFELLSLLIFFFKSLINKLFCLLIWNLARNVNLLQKFLQKSIINFKIVDLWF